MAGFISRRWGAAAVLVAVGVTTASTAVAATASPTVTSIVTTKPVKVAVTALRVGVAHSTVTAKGKYRDSITGTLTAAKVPLAGEKIRLDERKPGTSKWMLEAIEVTGKKGVATFVVTQSAAKQQYELVFLSHAGFAGSASAIVTVVKK